MGLLPIGFQVLAGAVPGRWYSSALVLYPSIFVTGSSRHL